MRQRDIAIIFGGEGSDGRRILKINRKMRITIFTERVTTVVKQGDRTHAVHECSVCQRPVQMLHAEEAAKLAAASHRLIYQMVESGNLHALETGDGSLLICTVSLADLDDGKVENRGMEKRV